MASTNEITVRTMYEAANARDLEAILAGTHEKVVITPVLGATLGADHYHGHEGVRQWTKDLWAEWETFEVSVGEVLERGDWLLYPVGIRARGRASGAEIDDEIFHVCTMRNGKVVGIEGFTDRESAMHALEAT
jgi:ketosteroid isomerase-like protein